MGLTVTGPPAVEPLSLGDVKLQCRLDPASSDEDSLLNALIAVARQRAEQFTRRALITQTWELWLDAWPKGSGLSLPRPPLQTVDSIKYYNTAGVEAEFAAANYQVDIASEPGRVSLGYGKSWPTTTLRPINGVCIEYDAGYGDAAASVPEAIRQAMLLIVGHLYEHREDAIDARVAPEAIPFGADALLWPYRVLP